MIVEATVSRKEDTRIEIDEIQALKILARSLYMDFAYDGNEYIVVGENEDKAVYKKYSDGTTKLVDDRGNLFEALMKLTVQIVMNWEYRSNWD